MDFLSGAIVLLVVVLMFFAVSYMYGKSKDNEGCGGGSCSGDCASCGMNVTKDVKKMKK